MTYTDTKTKITIGLTEATDDKLRSFAFKHRKIVTMSEVVEAALVHCLDNPHFIKKLTKKEEEIDY